MMPAFENNSRLRRALAWAARILAAFLVILFAARHGSFFRPPSQPESTNITGYFDFKVKDMKNFSQPWRYTWHNTGTIASVEQMWNVQAGTAKLMVHDGEGRQVYSRDLSEYGIFFTDPGVAGEWTIQVVFESQAH